MKPTKGTIINLLCSCLVATIFIAIVWLLSLLAEGAGEENLARQEAEANKRYIVIVGQDTIRNVKYNNNLLSRDTGTLPDGRQIIIPNNAIIIEEARE